jgi:hypothetical protein
MRREGRSGPIHEHESWSRRNVSQGGAIPFAPTGLTYHELVTASALPSTVSGPDRILERRRPTHVVRARNSDPDCSGTSRDMAGPRRIGRWSSGRPGCRIMCRRVYGNGGEGPLTTIECTTRCRRTDHQIGVHLGFSQGSGS